MSEPKGSLVVVGTGIKAVRHMTFEAQEEIRNADVVLYLVADPVVAQWIHELNKNAEALHRFYSEDKPRIETYNGITEYVLETMRKGHRVCFALYGHPGVFVYPSHRAIEAARRDGFEAEMQPGVSAEDCLFADLGIDPGSQGCQSFEATDFLVFRRVFDPQTPLILWQIAVIGDFGYNPGRPYNEAGLAVLVDTLSETYGSDHEVVVYEAAQYAVSNPVMDRVALKDIRSARLSGISTLYVPRKGKGKVDKEMLARLVISK
jgi:uncharacterized protein YabN with tetrapyrrole methylase and pyrophosphatase domain